MKPILEESLRLAECIRAGDRGLERHLAGGAAVAVTFE
jgi:hypothetical protein